MKRIALILLASFFTLCFTKVNAQSKTVPFAVGKRFFVRTDYPIKPFHMLKITSQEKFFSIFGMATVMGKGGQPTRIDFSKKYVIALIDNISHTTTAIKVASLTKNGDHLSLKYKV